MKLKISDDVIIDNLLGVTQGFNRMSDFVPRTDAIFSDLDLNEYGVNQLKDKVLSSIEILDNNDNTIATFNVRELESATKTVDNECRVSLIFS